MKKNQAEGVNFLKTGILTSALCMEAAIASAHVEIGHRWLGRDLETGEDLGRAPYSWSDDPTLSDVWDKMTRISGFIKAFDNQVWLSRIGTEYMSKEERGYEAHAGSVHVMFYALAGRVKITLQLSSGSYISLITDDCVDLPRIGQQGINATWSDAVWMLSGAINAFKAGGLVLRRNDDVKPDIVHAMESAK